MLPFASPQKGALLILNAPTRSQLHVGDVSLQSSVLWSGEVWAETELSPWAAAGGSPPHGCSELPAVCARSCGETQPWALRLFLSGRFVKQLSPVARDLCVLYSRKIPCVLQGPRLLPGVVLSDHRRAHTEHTPTVHSCTWQCTDTQFVRWGRGPGRHCFWHWVILKGQYEQTFSGNVLWNTLAFVTQTLTRRLQGSGLIAPTLQQRGEISYSILKPEPLFLRKSCVWRGRGTAEGSFSLLTGATLKSLIFAKCF